MDASFSDYFWLGGKRSGIQSTVYQTVGFHDWKMLNVVCLSVKTCEAHQIASVKALAFLIDSSKVKRVSNYVYLKLMKMRSKGIRWYCSQLLTLLLFLDAGIFLSVAMDGTRLYTEKMGTSISSYSGNHGYVQFVKDHLLLATQCILPESRYINVLISLASFEVFDSILNNVRLGTLGSQF